MAAPIECLLFLEAFCSKLLLVVVMCHKAHAGFKGHAASLQWTPLGHPLCLVSAGHSQWSYVPHTSCWYWAPLWLHTDMFACKYVHFPVILGQLISKIIIYEWSNFPLNELIKNILSQLWWCFFIGSPTFLYWMPMRWKMPGEASSILSFSVRVTPPLSLSKYLDRDSQKCLTSNKSQWTSGQNVSHIIFYLTMCVFFTFLCR